MEKAIDLSRLDDNDYAEAVKALYEYKQLYKQKYPEYDKMNADEKKHLDNIILSELVGLQEPETITELENFRKGEQS